MAQSLAALEWPRAVGCRQFYFKVCSTFDSTPAGNIGPVAEALLERLGADFTLLAEQEVPLVIREHARKYQYIVSHGMVWQRQAR